MGLKASPDRSSSSTTLLPTPGCHSATMNQIEYSHEDLQLIGRWNIQTIEHFLRVRNIDIPTQASFQDVVEIAIATATVPIRVVTLSRTVFEYMTHQQLISWLESREYVVLPKSKPMMTSAPGACYDQRRKLLEFAKSDYVDNIAHLDREDKYELETKLAEVFRRVYRFSACPPSTDIAILVPDPELVPHGAHRSYHHDEDLEMIWGLFFDPVEYPHKSRDEKNMIIQDCIRVFAQGPRRIQ